jgi:O-antigen/teichoic acid export membrane protein
VSAPGSRAPGSAAGVAGAGTVEPERGAPDRDHGGGGRVIARNIVSRLAAKSAGYLLGFAGSVLLVRYLGVERLGQYQYVTTFASLVGFVASIGLPAVLTRSAARDRGSAGRLLGNVLVLQYGLSFLAFVVVALSGALLNPADVAWPIAILGFGIGLSAAGAPYTAMLNAFEKMHVTSAIDIVAAVLRFALILAAIQLRLDVTGLVAILLVNTLVVLVLAKTGSDRTCVRADRAYDPAVLKRLMVSTLPFGLMTLFAGVYYRIDILMLAKMQGAAAVGVYSAAYKLIDVMMITGASISGVLYPRMAAHAAGSPDALKRLVERSHRYMTALGIPIALVVTTAAPWIIELLFGREFAAAGPVLRILVWATALTLMTMPLVHALNATGREWQWIGVLVLNSVVNVSLNLVLIPAYGIQGAAVSTLACELIALVMALVLTRPVGPVGRLAPIVPVGVAALGMAPSLWYFGEGHPVAAAALAGAAYLVVLHLAGFLSREEERELRRLFAGRGRAEPR